jgi:hypothetical protein
LGNSFALGTSGERNESIWGRARAVSLTGCTETHADTGTGLQRGGSGGSGGLGAQAGGALGRQVALAIVRDGRSRTSGSLRRAHRETAWPGS